MTMDDILSEVTARGIQYEILSETSFKLIHPELGTECLVIGWGDRFESYHTANGLMGLCSDVGIGVNGSFLN